MRKMILACAAVIALFCIGVAHAADNINLPDPDSPICDHYRPTSSVRQLVACSAAEKQRLIDSGEISHPAILELGRKMVRDRLEIIHAIDVGYLRTPREQATAFSDLIEHENQQFNARQASMQEIQSATLAAMAARAAAPIPDFSTTRVITAPAPAPSSFTCARLIGLPGYTRCTTD